MKPTKTTIFVIFLALTAVADADSIWVKVKGGGWEPNGSILTAMKAGIEGYVKTEAKRQKRQLLPWDEYRFQYLAVALKGENFILVNALCGKRNPRELEDFQIIADGGNCYFSLRYDPELQRYYDLAINGPG